MPLAKKNLIFVCPGADLRPGKIFLFQGTVFDHLKVLPDSNPSEKNTPAQSQKISTPASLSET